MRILSFVPQVRTQPQAGCSWQGEAQGSFGDEGDGDELFESPNVVSSGSSYHPSPRDAALVKVNASLKELKESPVHKRKLKDFPTYGAEKLQKISDKYESLLAKAGGSASMDSFERQFYKTTMSALKEKFQESSSNKDKIGVLSIALSSMSIRAVAEEFESVGATAYMVRKTASLMHDQGILPTPQPKKGRPLQPETVELIKQYYEDDEVSRQMPGKKDCVSVKEDGKKCSNKKDSCCVI